MDIINAYDVVGKAMAQALGSEYMSNAPTLSAVESYKLIDIGKDVADSERGNNVFGLNIASQMGKLWLDNREILTDDPPIFVDNMEWGGYVERVRFDITDIGEDSMWNLLDGKDYSKEEHTYTAPKGTVKIFEEAKPIGGKISVVDEQIHDAFNNWEQMNSYITGVWKSIDNTFKFKTHVINLMLHSAAIAISIKALENAVHLLTEAKARNIVSADTTAVQAINDKGFLAYAASRISAVRDNMKVLSTVYNNKTVPTFTPYDDSRVVLLSEFARNLKFNLRANTYNKDELGFGKFYEVASWQVAKNGDDSAFGFNSASAISIAADPTNKLGIGTDAVELDNVIGLVYDYYALGMTLNKFKVTSSYTACADFWNYFYHSLMNYIIDSSYSMVAFVVD